ncbi:MAG: NAD(P)(+) transhydrogenase (Re/Si-specific) subunit beta [Clostridiales bacterium]|nr:NAD(P)(+) transhydrogenase (Re/Si-specific) subunit beta [Clostridiales bacterium]
MTISIPAAAFYAISLLLVIGVLMDMNLMSSPKTAVLGNKIGAVSILLAIILTLLYYQVVSLALIAVFLLLGSFAGVIVAVKVKMIHMPQTVALLHCGGAGAAALVALASVLNGDVETAFSNFTAVLALVVGGLTFSGSLVAGGKLAGKIKQQPVIYKGHSAIFFATAIILAVLCLAALIFELTLPFLLAVLILALFFGYWFAIRIGGADMPIAISLLNSFSGVAGGIAGMAISEPLLVAIGGVIGAAGLILTQIMCRAMNQHLWDILSGKTSTSAAGKKTVALAAVTAAVPEPSTPSAPETDLKSIIDKANTVIIAPGYGLALAQAQHVLKSLCDKLEEQGKEVLFAIHPVAGRMPGHMNVLLAEVDISYDKLLEMDEINPRFPDTDLVLVVGANDVINPAAHTAEGTSIYGMPILEAAKARHIIICNFDTKPGYAGVDNPLYENPKSILLPGDAQETLQGLLDTVSSTSGQAETSAFAGSASSGIKAILEPAQTVVIAPGYGMALAQAQHLVKSISDKLEGAGKEVNFAIHPVAGRMPGHMNVLLAEAGVDYEKLLEMDEINPRFAATDLVLVVGANDVINPAAHTAEGTSIYGMPILEAAEARHIIICNFDTKPGYAGVDNPLYENPKTILLLGDAQETLQVILAELK